MAREHDHTYDCIVCGAHIDTQEELVRHNEEQHLSTAQGMERPRRDADSRDEGSRDGERKDPLPNSEL